MKISDEQNAEIDRLRKQNATTRRATVPALEDILYEPLPVLDQGFIRVIDYMGDDAAIVQAARVSYGRGTKQVSDDRGLINYLMRHRHTSPFEMCEIKLHIKLPIFIARQWIRHRTASLNEISARYSELPAEFYLPRIVHHQSRTNKQGIADEHECSADALETWEARNQEAFGIYRDDLEAGISREEARINLPLSTMTELYWKIDLHNLLHFTVLRADSHAQYEIRAYAEVLLDVLKRWVPLTHEAFLDYRMNSATLSSKGLAVVKRMLAGEAVDQDASGMSPGEWRELNALLENN